MLPAPLHRSSGEKARGFLKLLRLTHPCGVMFHLQSGPPSPTFVGGMRFQLVQQGLCTEQEIELALASTKILREELARR